ncbi:hypothetical protein OG943_15540 [Amycolatopsis sp. NBC_00345]|uniref:hypothetical protein n=1 Tax=Amycolatopsis sp. NBC_00345 TaxID=2975955 RepID=UPI002E262A97
MTTTTHASGGARITPAHSASRPPSIPAPSLSRWKAWAGPALTGTMRERVGLHRPTQAEHRGEREIHAYPVRRGESARAGGIGERGARRSAYDSVGLIMRGLARLIGSVARTRIPGLSVVTADLVTVFAAYRYEFRLHGSGEASWYVKFSATRAFYEGGPLGKGKNEIVFS